MKAKDLYDQITEASKYLAVREEIRDLECQAAKIRQQIEEACQRGEEMLQPLLKVCIEEYKETPKCDANCPELFNTFEGFCDGCPCVEFCPSLKKTFTD